MINHRSETVRGARRAIRYGWCYRVVAAALAGCLLLVGCSSSHPASTATTSTSLGESFSINTPEGTITLSLNGQLPPGWPSDFPLPPGASPAGSGSVTKSSGGHQVAVYQVPGTGLQAFDFYKDSGTLTISDAKSTGSGSKYVGRMNFSGSHTGSLTVIDVSSRTLLVVNLTT